MATDVEKYKDNIFIYGCGKIHKVKLCEIENMQLINYDYHHFLRKTIRKNSIKDYERWEQYQRMVIMPHKMNLDIESMGEKSFEKEWGIPKFVVVFNRDRWRTGFYDSKYFESFYN